MNMEKIENLDNKNLLILFDTVREISSELELETENTILIKAEQEKVEANLAKHLPDYSYDIIAELRRLRQKAVKYLQNNHIITAYEFCNDKENIKISVDRKVLSKFYKNITRVYEERYKTANKQENNVPLFDFEKEREFIKDISSGNRHRLYRDKWLNCKRVLDTIEDFIPINAIDESKKEITFEKSYFFSTGIPQKKEGVIYDTLSLLDKRNIIKIKKPALEDEIYIIRDPKGIFLNNRVGIVVEDKDLFEKHLTGLSAFVDYIEKDGRERFPNEYGIAPKAIPEQEKKHTYLDSGFNHYLIRDNKTPIEKQLSEITELLKENKNKEDPRIDKRCLIQTPTETKWSDVNIKWINGNDVEITLNNSKEFREIKDFKELGFYDEKRKCPNILWKILSNAAAYGGKMSWDNLGGTSESDRHKKIDAFQKQISLLRNKLREIFGSLKGEKNAPFIPYSKDKEYVITINLFSEKNNRSQKKESWKDLMSEAELNNYERIEKVDFIKNPNQILTDDNDY